MILKRARITNFKSVLDSEWFNLDDLTCLVGKNESGKTAVLEALGKINAVDPERGNFSENEYPRMRKSDYDESGRVDKAVESEWELQESEMAYLNGLAGEGVFTSSLVVISKDYSNVLSFSLAIDYRAALKNLLAESGLTDDDVIALGEFSTTEQLIGAITSLAEPSSRHTTFLQQLRERFPEGALLTTANAYIKKQIPKFVYYSQYDNLQGRVSIDQIIQATASNTLDQIEGSKVFLALLSMVGTTVGELKDINTSEALITKLEAVQSRITNRIFKYWSQNKHLKVRFLYGEASPGDLAPFNEGKVFQTRIENTRHEATINLSDRSTGFIWFFSFLVWFSEVQREYGNNLIVLLDEPGLSLHAKAQYDLLRYMREELVNKYQVVYTTHSPFMIESSNLLSCRTVEDSLGKDDEVLGTKVGDKVLSTDNDTLFPLQAALGYDITQSMFVGEHCLLVEGPSDLLYIQWASNELASKKRISLDKRWTVTPCGGIAKVFSFMALFGGSRLHVAVLTDYGQGDKAKVRELRESSLLADGHVLTADSYTGVEDVKEGDIEDILGRKFYTDLVNKTYKLNVAHKLPVRALADASERVTEEVSTHFRILPNTVPEYDHYAPAKYLVVNTSLMTISDTDEALNRFEKLFHDINELL